MAYMDYTGIQNHPFTEVRISNEVEKGYWASSLFDYLTGTGFDRVIRQYKVSDLKPFVARLKGKSYGEGARGNANIQDNLDSIDWYAKTTHVEVYANGYESEIDYYSKTIKEDFISECKENLIQWFAEKSDRMILANLTNNLTNVVCAKANSKTGIQEYTAGDTISKLCDKVSAGDVCSVDSIRQLIFRARNGIHYDNTQTFVLKPSRIEVKMTGDVRNNALCYILFLDPYQAMQLKNDPEWREMQAVNHNQGFNNNLFTGFLGTIDSCWLVELPSWSSEQPGLLNTSVDNSEFSKYVNADATLSPLETYKGKVVDTSIGLLVGAGACIYGNSGTVRLLYSKSDMGRKQLIGADKILGINKTVFDAVKSGLNNNSMYHGKDFGVIGYVTAKE